MKKTRIVASLLIIACIVFILGTLSVYADNTTPTTITTITTNSSNSTTIGDDEDEVENETEDEDEDETENKVTGITPIGGVNNTANNTTNRVSSYNNTSTTSKDNLPYTGTNYSIIFVIAALAISAVYAYKKVTDYNV